jgi:hypothetical protein
VDPARRLRRLTSCRRQWRSKHRSVGSPAGGFERQPVEDEPVVGDPPVADESVTERDLAWRFAEAFIAADLTRIVALLTHDAWLSMPPAPHEYHGIGAIAAFLRAAFAYRGDRRVYQLPARANTQPAFGSYLADPAGRFASPAGLFVLTVAGNRVQAITRFHVDVLYPGSASPPRWRKPGSLSGRPGQTLKRTWRTSPSRTT